MSSTNRFRILLVHLDREIFSISSPIRLRSNTKILTFHMLLKEWLINLTPSKLGSTSNLAMARFSSAISQGLLKYPYNNKDNLYNNKGSIFYARETFVAARDLRATIRENYPTARSPAITERSILTIVAACYTIADEICSAHLSTHVLVGPTSGTAGPNFALQVQPFQ